MVRRETLTSGEMGIEVIGLVIAGLVAIGVPGFLFSLVLYPKLESFDFLTRAGMSLGLGALLVLIEGYALARMQALVLGGFVVSTAVLCGIFLPGVYFFGGSKVVSAYWRGFVRGLHWIKNTKLSTLRRLTKKVRPHAKPQHEAAHHHPPATEHHNETAHHTPTAEHFPEHKEKT